MFSLWKVLLEPDDAVVVDRHLDAAAAPGQADGYMAGVGVLPDILQGLLEDAVEGELDIAGEARCQFEAGEPERNAFDAMTAAAAASHEVASANLAAADGRFSCLT